MCLELKITATKQKHVSVTDQTKKYSLGHSVSFSPGFDSGVVDLIPVLARSRRLIDAGILA